MLGWLKRESIATLAMLGAALTVLAQLGTVMPMAPWLKQIVDYWQLATRGFWRPPLAWLGAPLHHDLVAAITLAVFLTMIGVGARVSSWLGEPAGEHDRRLSLMVFVALSFTFLIGHEVSGSGPLVIWGSRTAGKYAFALTVAAGYTAGDYIGYDEFHRRLLRLAVLAVLLVVANLVTVWWPTA